MSAETEYLTTKEVAGLLRLKERKVYDLVAEKAIPCTRATGKHLFSRAAIDRWLAQNSSGDSAQRTMPELIAGSHDPLLEWAVRESQCGLATLFDGSVDGLQKMAGKLASVSALHLYSQKGDSWNVEQVAEQLDGMPVVLVQWVQRQRGLVFRKDTSLTGPEGLKQLPIAARQASAGSQVLLEQLLLETGIDKSDWHFPLVTRSEQDAVLAVAEGAVDCTLGLESLARQHRLEFRPVLEESFDLLIDRRFWFEPAMQKFIAFCQSDVFRCRVEELDGYRLDKLFGIRYNG